MGNSNIARRIKNEISAHGDESKARWLENYVKHDVRSRGVGIPQIRNIIRTINREEKISALSPEKQAYILDELMQSPWTEDKLAAILIMQLFWSDAEVLAGIDRISNWFKNQWISDWNVCDWLCVRILTPLIDTSHQDIIPVFESWNKSNYLWQARASLVPFAQCKTITDHVGIIRKFSAELIKREERFCKTAVGWVLREYSRIDKGFVVGFLNEYQDWATKEVERNAKKYIKG